ncbi:hypothetical protein BLA29_014670 [Euroglyphus maynei]|uniref:Uncharacterized protein n=1 Tax=Euroglyphus maynei TaxID=6958 RepID=A0A1Y3AT16_EURMA|nr:hypothetical protein BLA29_014670 [Euroglyphus maynei]
MYSFQNSIGLQQN